jgi:Tat protein translocase TatB subunit
MFGSLGGPEVLLLFVIALLLFGPRKLPEIGRMVGRSVAEFRKATNEFRSTLEREVEIEDLKELGRAGAALKDAGQETAAVVREATGLGGPRPGALPAATPLAEGHPTEGGVAHPEPFETGDADGATAPPDDAAERQDP